MSFKSGNDLTDGVRQKVSTDQEHRPVLTHSFSSSPLATHSFPPEIKRAAFYSRSSSHSSIASSHHANELDYHQSRPGTPLSVAPDSSGESGIAGSWVAKQQRQNTLIQHLHKHASTFGLDVSSISGSANADQAAENSGNKEMSTQGDTMLHQGPAFLSWRKLHLSKAKLKAASNTSALLAGFAMVAVVEIQLNNNNSNNNSGNNADGTLPKPLLILFAICTTLLVAVHMLALLISTCILPNMEAISNLHSLSLVHESPHEKMHMYIELAWGCSTVLGILLFMIEVIILCWIQFYSVLKEAAYVATAILVPFLILFIWFAIIFYRNLVAHTYETRKSQIEELKHVLEMGDDLPSHRELHNNGQMVNMV